MFQKGASQVENISINTHPSLHTLHKTATEHNPFKIPKQATTFPPLYISKKTDAILQIHLSTRHKHGIDPIHRFHCCHGTRSP